LNKHLILNTSQKQAVEHLDGPLLVSAGPGSGKTKVIVERIRFLVENGHAKKSEILCLTFSEKAAHVMSDRLINDIKIESQIPSDPKLKELLKNASKHKGKGIGRPEFIITFTEILDSVIIIECKADLKNHENKKGKSPEPEKYAVDGVLHYASFLKKDFNVLAIAVSGTKEDQLKISHFYFKDNVTSPKILPDKKLLNIFDYLDIFEENELAKKYRDVNLLKFASTLNKQLYSYNVPENERATIVSGILIALQNKPFRHSYKIYKHPQDLVIDLLNAIDREFSAKNLGSKSKILMGGYSKTNFRKKD